MRQIPIERTSRMRELGGKTIKGEPKGPGEVRDITQLRIKVRDAIDLIVSSGDPSLIQSYLDQIPFNDADTRITVQGKLFDMAEAIYPDRPPSGLNRFSSRSPSRHEFYVDEVVAADLKKVLTSGLIERFATEDVPAPVLSFAVTDACLWVDKVVSDAKNYQSLQELELNARKTAEGKLLDFCKEVPSMNLGNETHIGAVGQALSLIETDLDAAVQKFEEVSGLDTSGVELFSFKLQAFSADLKSVEEKCKSDRVALKDRLQEESQGRYLQNSVVMKDAANSALRALSKDEINFQSDDIRERETQIDDAYKIIYGGVKTNSGMLKTIFDVRRTVLGMIRPEVRQGAKNTDSVFFARQEKPTPSA